MTYYNIPPRKLPCRCSFCNGEIIEGDEYLQNQDDECIHYDCTYYMTLLDVLKWLGVEIKEV